MAEKKTISAASAKLGAGVYRILGIYPTDRKCCGFRMTREQAIELATKILAVAVSNEADGEIEVTGYPPRRNLVSIIRHGGKGPKT